MDRAVLQPAAGRGLRSTGALVLLAVGTFATGTDAFVTSGLLAGIAEDLGVPLETAGLLVTLFSVSYVVGAPVVAAVAGAWDRRRLLLAAQTVFAAGMALQALGDTLGTVAAGRVLAGIGAAGYTANAAAVGAALVPAERRGRALALVMGGLTVGTVLGVPLGTLLGAWSGWRVTLACVAALGLVAAAGTFALPRVTLPEVGLRDRLTALARPGVPRVLAVTVTGNTAGFLLYTFLPAAAEPVATGAGLSVVLLVWGAASAVGNTVAGRGADRRGPLTMVRIALVGLALVLALFPLLAHRLPTLLAATAAFGAFAWMTMVPQQHRLVALAPEVATVLLGWNASATYLGAALGSLVGGGVLAAAGPAALGPVGALVALLALALSLLPVPAGRPVSQARPAGPPERAGGTSGEPARAGEGTDESRERPARTREEPATGA